MLLCDTQSFATRLKISLLDSVDEFKCAGVCFACIGALYASTMVPQPPSKQQRQRQVS